MYVCEVRVEFRFINFLTILLCPLVLFFSACTARPGSPDSDSTSSTSIEAPKDASRPKVDGEGYGGVTRIKIDKVILATVTNPNGQIQTLVTILGENFVVGATITINQQTCSNVQIDSENRITCSINASAPTISEVVVSAPERESGVLVVQQSNPIPPPPAITSLSIVGGSSAGGTPMQIQGGNFAPGVKVWIGQSAASNVVLSGSILVSFTTPAMAPGVYDIKVENLDGQSATFVNAFTVTAANQAPNLSIIGNQSVNENVPIATINANDGGDDFDVDGNPISYSCYYDTNIDTQVALTNPCSALTGVSFNGGTGVLNWTPNYSQANNYEFKIIGSDGSLSDSKIFTIAVNNVNRAPILSAIGNQSVNVNVPIATIDANDGGDDTDVDGDAISYTCYYDTNVDGSVLASTACTSLSGVSFSGSTGILNWTPNPSQSGTYEFMIVGSDLSLTNSKVFTVTVASSQGTWVATSMPAEGARWAHIAVWTGMRMIVWGGLSGGGLGGNHLNTGSSYDPLTDSWSPITTTGAPSARANLQAVWTGSKMVVWGGYPYTNTGGRYDPVSDTWLSMSTTNAPSAREGYSMIWTGGEVIVWGGLWGNTARGNGGIYNPSTDTWTAGRDLATSAPAARAGHTAIWTGSKMVVFGGGTGWDGATPTNTGGQYDPRTNLWTGMSSSGVPEARIGHTAIWTGREMIVIGGANGTTYYTSGYRYYPTQDVWGPIAPSGAPQAANGTTAIWTGSKMLVWGGWGLFNAPGGMYDPTADTWTAMSTTLAPSNLLRHTAVWTGSEMIIFGGSGAKFIPPPDTASDTWLATNSSNAPAIRTQHSAVWTGSEMIVWGGWNFEGTNIYYNTGGRYNPVTDSWTPTSTTSAPVGRYGHAAVWSGREMIIWAGWSGSNTGAKYNPVSDTWIPMGGTPPAARVDFSYGWTGSRFLVAGGGFNNGGSYDPETNSWTQIPSSAVLGVRSMAMSVWTGREFIVWGGVTTGGVALSSGAKYDPLSGNWTATTLTGAPSSRYSGTAVWTGSKMIVWGGTDSNTWFNNGYSYDPNSDAWSPINTSGTPDGRQWHSAVWTGAEMIVWGGWHGSGGGALYNPRTNQWRNFSTTQMPPLRWQHTAVWTGREMIVWGGYNGAYLNTGGRYIP